MYQYDDPSCAGSLPTPAAPGSPGYFTDGVPGVTPATALRSDYMNMQMMELLNVLVAGGVTPSKTAYNQVATAISNMIAAAASAINPTGAVAHFFGSAAPTGWVQRNGGTIGNASSGATTRANADTQALFTLIYNSTTDSTDSGSFHLQNSSGSAVSRGSYANAAAAWAANCRLPLPNDAGLVDRGLDTTGTIDPDNNVLAVSEQDAMQGHTHDFPNLNPSGSGSGFAAGAGTQTSTGTTTTQTGRVSTETRMKNRAYLAVIKL